MEGHDRASATIWNISNIRVKFSQFFKPLVLAGVKQHLCKEVGKGMMVSIHKHPTSFKVAAISGKKHRRLAAYN